MVEKNNKSNQVKNLNKKIVQKYIEKNTKVICTIGPSTKSLDVLRKMYKKGMDCVRINTAHGTKKECLDLIRKVRNNFNIPIIIDIKGPEIRIKTNKTVKFKKGDLVKFYKRSKNDLSFNSNVIPILKKGDLILVADGKYKFRVQEKNNDFVMAKALNDSVIEPNKNVHLPEKIIKLPSLTKKDKEYISLSIKEKVDYIALSFCRSKKDILNLRKILKRSNIKIISKIENHEGIKNIDEIIEYSDGVMVARGDLGVEYPIGEVPVIQKKIIKKCNFKGKIVIVATEMLESMINNSQPTRAEVSDIANAILDGADALMLSAESTIGKYPVEAVECMSKTARTTEPFVKQLFVDDVVNKKKTTSEAISYAVKNLCKELNFDKIICLTYEGHTAQRISRFKVNKPILALTSSDELARQLMLYYGVHAIHLKENFWNPSTKKVLRDLYKRGILMKSDFVLFTAGLYTLKENNTNTNTIHIHKMVDLVEYLERKKQL